MAASIAVARQNLAARQRKLREKAGEQERLVGAGLIGAVTGYLEGTGKLPVAVFGSVPVKLAGAVGFGLVAMNATGDTRKWATAASQALAAIYSFEAMKQRKFVAGESDFTGEYGDDEGEL